MAELPNMSLKALKFDPVAFTPFQYEYKPNDFSILERSLAQREKRMNEAAEAKGAIDVALAETELKLHENDKEWFRNYKEDINNKIQSNIDAGNFGVAFRTAKTTAGEVAKDSAILSRIEANTKYLEDEKALNERVKSGEISQDTKEWWLATQGSYENRITYDDKGVATLKDTGPLYSEITDSEIWGAMAKFISAEKGSSSSQGSNTNADGTGRGWQSGKSYERLSKERLQKAVLTFMSDSTMQGRFKQRYNVEKFKIEKLQQEYNSTSDENRRKEIEVDLQSSGMLGANIQIVSYEEYQNNKLKNSPWGDLLSYEYVTTTSGSTTDNQGTKTGNGQTPTYGILLDRIKEKVKPKKGPNTETETTDKLNAPSAKGDPTK